MKVTWLFAPVLCAQFPQSCIWMNSFLSFTIVILEWTLLIILGCCQVVIQLRAHTNGMAGNNRGVQNANSNISEIRPGHSLIKIYVILWTGLIFHVIFLMKTGDLGLSNMRVGAISIGFLGISVWQNGLLRFNKKNESKTQFLILYHYSI